MSDNTENLVFHILPRRPPHYNTSFNVEQGKVGLS